MPRTRTRFGERGFSYCGPAAWNTLPSDLHHITDISTFRKRLKSVLFDRAYHWLLLALLDVSYSGALQISRWLIDWVWRWPLHAAALLCWRRQISIDSRYTALAVADMYPSISVARAWTAESHPPVNVAIVFVLPFPALANLYLFSLQRVCIYCLHFTSRQRKCQWKNDQFGLLMLHADWLCHRVRMKESS